MSPDVGAQHSEEKQPLRCPVCGSTDIIFKEDTGEYVCARCGTVIMDKYIDQGPEWRAFTPEERERRGRTGAPLSPTLHDQGISTIIDHRDRDALGRRLDARRRMEVLRWRKWQMRTRMQTGMDRNLTIAMNELDKFANILGLPKQIKEEAAVIYRKAVEKGLVRGRSIESVVAAVIYAACRIHHQPRTLDEISKALGVNRKDMARCYRLMLKELKLDIPITDPIDHIPRIGQQLGLRGDIIAEAINIMKKVKGHAITAGKDPAGIAAAAIYIAVMQKGERRTQKEIAQVAGVTEVTVRNRYKELIKILEKENKNTQ
ncbi:transcription initiation factor IIB [Ignicoccus islandicus DSM 13165]|uniref:Transcription initiation factor IIB n=1 Tax=Ignicoccus islandicus DSM 13165 TaxID=940295 RepID=A0A0U2WM50_9CREN|nr:transcription initiation factor IIB [Ignicoccus islandicus]ALU12033.1 transcription initiation factor IIB [Ignicoccus islandicus DSM 13165]